MEELWLEGAISVKAALEARRRTVFELLTDGRKPDRNRRYIFSLAEQMQVPIYTVSEEKIAELTAGSSHGGLLARVGDRVYETPEQLISHPVPFLVFLDGIEDPFNFAGAIRSLYAAGVTGLFVSERNWCNAAGTVTRASAGASEYLPTAKVSDLNGTLDQIRGKGIRILCAERKNAESLYSADLTGPILLVLGGEMRGISASILKKSDQNLYIPYGRDFRNALSANSAAAVFSFEALRQRSGQKIKYGRYDPYLPTY